MTAADWLRDNLKLIFMLPEAAIDWLLMLWDAIQLFDDVADGDPVARADLDKVIWNCLVAMPQNSFYSANSLVLNPVVGAMILKWQGADARERTGYADARSFVWRAGFYDVVLITLAQCHGPAYAMENASRVLELYGESFEAYKKEFEPCQTQ